MRNFDTIELLYYLLVVLWYVVFIGFVIYLHFRYGIPYQNDYDKEYSDEVPSSLPPGALSMLMYKKIIPEVFTATIIVLLKKGILSVRLKKEDYIFSLTDEINCKLSNSQKYVLTFLKEFMNTRNEISLSKIYNYCNSNRGSSDFLLNYQIWKRLMLKESCKWKFFEDKIEYQKIRLIKYIGVVLFVINFILAFHFFIGYFILIPIYLLSYYFYKVYKRTIDANEEYHKWLAYRNYLSNITNYKYDKRQMDKYLLYAIVLKVNNELLEHFPNHFNNQFIHKLNETVNRCVVRATLYGNRSIRGHDS